MRVCLSVEALADVEQAADWYVDQDAAAAARGLHDELAHALARLGAEPGLGTPAWGDTRVLPIHRFPVFGGLSRVGR